MCKVAMFTNLSKVKNPKRLITAIRKGITQNGCDDGFGYACVTTDNKVFGEKTISPDTFEPLKSTLKKRIEDLQLVRKSSQCIGSVDFTRLKAGIFHGRMSTNDVTIENTHPFFSGETAFIHNGVIQDAGDDPVKCVTTCDSEIALRYWQRGGIKEVEKNITGYYVLGIIENGLLHVVRDDRARLVVSYIPSIDSFIFTTTPELLKDICRRMRWLYEAPEQVEQNTYSIFDGNQCIKFEHITPKQVHFDFRTEQRVKSALGERVDSLRSRFDQGQISLDSISQTYGDEAVEALAEDYLNSDDGNEDWRK